MEGLPKKEKRDNNFEKKNIFEKFKEAAKPMLRYGLLSLIAVKSFNFDSFNDNSIDQTINENQIENIAYDNSPSAKEGISEDTYDPKKVVYGEESFRYYDPLILKDFQTFYEYVKDDPVFLDYSDFSEIKYNHSQYRFDELKRYSEDPYFTEEERADFKKDIEGFELVEDFDSYKIEILKEKYEKISEHIKDVESQKDWLKKIIESISYLEKLSFEFGGDFEKAKEIQNQRLSRISEYKYYFSNDPSLSLISALGHVEIYGEHQYNAFVHGEKLIYEDGTSKYNPTTETIKYRSLTEKNLTSLHEFEHQTTIKLITEYAEKLLMNNFEGSNLVDDELENLDYYFNVDEIIARKRVFDYELEKLGVKKYDEEFTENHYKDVKIFQRAGKLSRGADLFFREYEKDSLMLIMNTVAETISQQESNPNEAVA